MAFTLPIGGYGQTPYGPAQNPILQLLMQVVGQAQSGQNQAKQANESRYQDILKMFGDNRQRTMDSLNTFGQSAINDANRNYDTQRNNLLTDLADRGLGGSTKRIGVETGVQRERDAEINRINDTLTQNKNAADLGFTDRATGVMERRSDPYPNTSNVGALVAQLAPLLNGSQYGGQYGGQYGPQYASGYGVGGYGGYGYPGATSLLGQQSSGVGRTFQAPSGPTAAQQRAAKQTAQNAAYDEQQRRGAMINLTSAMQPGWVNISKEQNALNYLVNNGWAQQNPAATTNTLVNTAQPQYQPQYQQYQPQQGGSYGRTPLWQRDPNFQSALNAQGINPQLGNRSQQVALAQQSQLANMFAQMPWYNAGI